MRMPEPEEDEVTATGGGLRASGLLKLGGVRRSLLKVCFVEPWMLSSSMKNSVARGRSTVICVRKYVTVYTKLLWTHRRQNQRFFLPWLLQLLLQNKNFAAAVAIKRGPRLVFPRARVTAWNRKRIPPVQNEWSLVHNIFKLVINLLLTIPKTRIRQSTHKYSIKIIEGSVILSYIHISECTQIQHYDHWRQCHT